MNTIRSMVPCLACALMALAGCSEAETADVDQRLVEDQAVDTPSPIAEKSGDGELRTDLEPLTSRWTFVDIESAVWLSGTMGDDRVPGPSTYWVDAVITTSAAEIDRLIAEFEPTPADAEPPVIEGLEIPDGEALTSADLNVSANEVTGNTDLWIYPDTQQIVLVAIFE